MKHPILKYMKKHKMTEKELAEKCGFSVYVLKALIEYRWSRAIYLYKLCSCTDIKADDYIKYFQKNRKRSTAPIR